MDEARAFAVAAITSLLLFGCASEPKGELGSTRQSIIGGAPDDTTNSAVFIVAHVGSKDGYCSGVVVSPHVVLTAAHCSSLKANYRIFLGTEYDVTAKDQSAEDFVEVVRNVPYPKWDKQKNEGDIGVLVTAAPIPRAAVEIGRASLTDAELGRPLRIVGFGQTSGTAKTFGRRTQATAMLAGFDDVSLAFKGTPNICFNDSGGPSYATADGKDVIVGIHSLVSASTCDDIGVDTRVDVFADFIDAQIREAEPHAAAPPSQGEPDASDAAPATLPPAPAPPSETCSLTALPGHVGQNRTALSASALSLGLLALLRRRKSALSRD